jgi:D-sedoheptulose 7-phosphate isomerase
MELDNMQLNHRANAFARIITDTICTSGEKKTIPLEIAMLQVMENLRKIRQNKQSLYIIGNGGSAAVASHAQVDFVNVAKINAQVLHESSLITCMANDFGYENVYSRVISQFIKSGDILIAISSSGKSKNIFNAMNVAIERGVKVVTFTGFDPNNPLRQFGHFNFWLDSYDYGYVEVGHQFILHNLSDRFGVENIKLVKETVALV